MHFQQERDSRKELERTKFKCFKNFGRMAKRINRAANVLDVQERKNESETNLNLI